MRTESGFTEISCARGPPSGPSTNSVERPPMSATVVAKEGRAQFRIADAQYDLLPRLLDPLQRSITVRFMSKLRSASDSVRLGLTNFEALRRLPRDVGTWGIARYSK